MTKKSEPLRSRSVTLPATGKSTMRGFGGSEHDEWNSRLMAQVIDAIPHREHAIVENAVALGMHDMKPTDPIEAMMCGQLLAANATALDLYRRAWLDEQGFEVRTRFLALADKAARTVALLTETLDRRRRGGHQHVTVRHMTVNADQAIVGDVVTGGVSQ